MVRGRPDTISRPVAADTFITDGFAVGQEITISGSAAGNNGLYRITAVAAQTLTVSGELNAEASAAIRVNAARAWESLNRGLAITEILSASFDPLNNVIFAGTQDNGVIEQPRPSDGVDNDNDGLIDEDDERFHFDEVVVVIRPGDGNTTAVVSLGNSQTLRFTMSNNLRSLGTRVIDANGDLVAGTDNLVLLRSALSDTKTFTVTVANDRLRIPGHGFNTGDGPFYVSAVPGPGPVGTPAVPGGLTEWREYFVIRVSANEIRLATSVANANAGTQVDLTSDGAGTRRLSQRFSGLSAADQQNFTSGFREIPIEVNAVDSTRMVLGLSNAYVSKNIGTAAVPLYDRLETVERASNMLRLDAYSALAYGTTANPDVLYGAGGNRVGITVPHVFSGDLTFTAGAAGASDTITRTSGSWSDDGFGPGQAIVIAKAGANDGRYVIKEVTSATVLTLKASGLVTTTPAAVVGVRADLVAWERIENVLTITDIVVDLDDWKVAYATTDSGVFKRTGPDRWELISQNLVNFNLDSIELVKAPGHDILLVGGVTGVSRAIDPVPGVAWTEFGRNLPNAQVRDLTYIDPAAGLDNPDSLERVDLLLAATLGRGAWTVPQADSYIAQDAVLSIQGGSGNDTVLIKRQAGTAVLDVYVNGASTPAFSLPMAALLKIEFFGEGGDDRLTIDSTDGPVALPQGVHFNGGAGGTDELILNGDQVEAVTTVVDGTVTHVKATDTRSDVPQMVDLEDVETNTNNLTEPSFFERIAAGLKRFFKWLTSWMDDEADDDLAVVGGSLPKALNGGSGDEQSALEDPVDAAAQVVASGGIVQQPGLQRLIEGGTNGFSLSEIVLLPVVPLVAFLVLLNGGYCVAFIAAGGQTIGKMAAGIKVVPTGVETSRSDRVGLGTSFVRAAAYLVSVAPAGAGLLPALLTTDRRAVHDRLAHTRVVKA